MEQRPGGQGIQKRRAQTAARALCFVREYEVSITRWERKLAGENKTAGYASFPLSSPAVTCSGGTGPGSCSPPPPSSGTEGRRTAYSIHSVIRSTRPTSSNPIHSVSLSCCAQRSWSSNGGGAIEDRAQAVRRRMDCVRTCPIWDSSGLFRDCLLDVREGEMASWCGMGEAGRDLVEAN